MKISIVVPIYNVEKYLKKCVDSLISQTYKDIEIILVDDGSPDNCKKICDEYKIQDERIKVIHKKNGGLSDARNKGTEVATGEYILYVDADDFVEKTACEELAKIINKFNPDIICFNCNKINDKGENMIQNSSIYRYDNTKKTKVLTFEEAMIDNLYRKSIRYEAWSKIYKREIVIKEKFPEGMLAEDFATFYKFLRKAKKIIYYDRCLYNYVVREGSIMSEKKVKLYVDIYKTEHDIYMIFNTICKSQKEKEQLEKRHFNNLSKIYAKLYKTSDEQYKKIELDVRNDMNKIKFKLLKNKEKILYIIFRINKGLFVFGIRKVYKNI